MVSTPTPDTDSVDRLDNKLWLSADTVGLVQSKKKAIELKLTIEKCDSRE